jgi:hypothetical protein
MIEGELKITDLGEIRDSWNLTALSKGKEGDFFRLSEMVLNVFVEAWRTKPWESIE